MKLQFVGKELKIIQNCAADCRTFTAWVQVKLTCYLVIVSSQPRDLLSLFLQFLFKLQFRCEFDLNLRVKNPRMKYAEKKVRQQLKFCCHY